MQDVEPGLQPAAQLAIEAGQASDWPARNACGVRIVCRLGVSLGFVEELSELQQPWPLDGCGNSCAIQGQIPLSTGERRV
jgi:hypothetical protein